MNTMTSVCCHANPVSDNFEDWISNKYGYILRCIHTPYISHLGLASLHPVLLLFAPSLYTDAYPSISELGIHLIREDR